MILSTKKHIKTMCKCPKLSSITLYDLLLFSIFLYVIHYHHAVLIVFLGLFDIFVVMLLIIAPFFTFQYNPALKNLVYP